MCTPTSKLKFSFPPPLSPSSTTHGRCLCRATKGSSLVQKRLCYIYIFGHICWLITRRNWKFVNAYAARNSSGCFSSTYKLSWAQRHQEQGVMCPATLMASSYSTSPHMRRPDFLEGSSLKFIPTSITQAPGLIQSAHKFWLSDCSNYNVRLSHNTW